MTKEKKKYNNTCYNLTVTHAVNGEKIPRAKLIDYAISDPKINKLIESVNARIDAARKLRES